MREYTDLATGLAERISADRKNDITLPLTVPAETLGDELHYTFTYDAPDDADTRNFFLETDSLSGRCGVYIGGRKAAALCGRYGTRRAELTGYIRPGKNEIDLTIVPRALPDGRFTFGGARMISADASHFALSADGDSGLNVHTAINGLTARVSVSVEVINPNNYDVAVFTLYDPSGRAVETRTAKPTAAQVDFSIDAPELWDGPHSPCVYTLQALLRRDSFELDKTSCTFGIRSFTLTKDGFFSLNGIKTPLCGVSLTDFCSADDDFEALGELDANCVRLSGLPADDDVLTRCDEAGILAWIDVPCSEDENDIDEIRALAKLAATHPCAAVLSTSVKDPGFAKEWCKTVKQYAMYTCAALNSDIFNSEGIIDAVPDILAVSIPSQTALNDFNKLGNRFAELRETHPEFRYAMFADSPECIFDRHSSNVRRSDCSQEYFSSWHERFWDTFGAQKGVIGIFAGQLSDKSGKAARTGLMTCDREEKKDAFWFYKAQFSASEFVRLCSAGQTLVTSKYSDIKCYSNSPAVTLTLNGKENKKYACEKISDCIYVFRDVRLKRRNNTIVITTGTCTDSEVIFRSRSRLTKK